MASIDDVGPILQQLVSAVINLENLFLLLFSIHPLSA